MAFCPVYNLSCPQSTECAIWTDYGCCLVDKPGIPAIYSGVTPSIRVYIVNIFSSNAKVSGDILIVYADGTTGEISTSDTLSDFAVAVLSTNP